ncbi:uncharacterized protein EV420DRAFT_1477155 [Desarmillaria tabescens]|uniref:Uncharacterized protein n=1 Tax=Armillaria tabescens TaxID=1929756 RepID=A0AA39NBE6_ARMTA|nr:uncharacterized protein EV420DRAFT_1477155 [Desarmillaria tabescens]KAK0462428.1 hypothetical protein EV420DRAFT_1477155 [Desarmillaria tabescens]
MNQWPWVNIYNKAGLPETLVTKNWKNTTSPSGFLCWKGESQPGIMVVNRRYLAARHRFTSVRSAPDRFTATYTTAKFRTKCLSHFLASGESDVYDSIKSILLPPHFISGCCTVGLPPPQERALKPPSNLKHRPLVEDDIRTDGQSIGFSCVNEDLWCNAKCNDKGTKHKETSSCRRGYRTNLHDLASFLRTGAALLVDISLLDYQAYLVSEAVNTTQDTIQGDRKPTTTTDMLPIIPVL